MADKVWGQCKFKASIWVCVNKGWTKFTGNCGKISKEHNTKAPLLNFLGVMSLDKGFRKLSGLGICLCILWSNFTLAWPNFFDKANTKPGPLDWVTPSITLCKNLQINTNRTGYNHG